MAGERTDSEHSTRSPEKRPAARRRRWVLVAVPLLFVAWFGLYGNKARLDMYFDSPAAAVRPGETATFPTPGGECIIGFHRVYEPYVLGLWRQTHPQRSPWWSPGPSGATFSTLACAIDAEQITVTVPGDVTADRIAMCDTDNRCVEIKIDHSG